MTEPLSPARLRGLDLMRAAAILLVLMSHYMGFVSHAPTFAHLFVECNYVSHWPDGAPSPLPCLPALRRACVA